MWLRDFLPKEKGLEKARIMTFNHNSAWQVNALSKSLLDYGNDLLSLLKDERRKIEVSTHYLRIGVSL